jgi:acyl-CoA thioesterase-1
MVRPLSFFAFVTFCFGTFIGCASKAPAPEENAPKLEAAKTPEPPADPRPVLVCFGDSITAGFGLEPGKTYPDVLQRLIDEGGFSYRVVNLGVSGDTTQGALDRVNTAVEVKPKITIVELGGNDGLRGIPLARSRDNLQQIVVRIKNAGSKVLLAGITLPPNYGREYIAGFEQMYVSVAKGSADSFMPFVLDGVWNKKGMMQEDQIHPTALGAEQMAKNIFKFLRPILEKPAPK